ncbi:DUF1810 domain-containing protein [Actinoplanes sp. NPDC051851]|uniref:DUF1810 domain-containing protein n=1 Tax=Actinoplanes sp. NPDC051851 TaxID=3154753 RepID=UPI0034303430
MSELQRFVDAQDGIYERALAELAAGQKRSHWMWFVFPQLAGLGSSPTARRYAIRDLAEARDYLAHPLLGARLIECAETLLGLPEGADVSRIFGFPDDLKLRSSMTLFARADDSGVFERVLKRFCEGPDPRTGELLAP